MPLDQEELCTFRCALYLKRIYYKYRLNHILLLFCYVIFLLFSAFLFYTVEHKQSDFERSRWLTQLAADRHRFVTRSLLPDMFNNTRLLLYIHDEKARYLTKIVNSRLETYENALRLQLPIPKEPCTFLNSLIFVFCTVTTMGHAGLYPVSRTGKLLSIGIAICGIPFTIVVINHLVNLIAALFQLPCLLLGKIWSIFRFCTLRPVKEEELEKELHGKSVSERDYRLQKTHRLLAIPVTIAILALIGWIALGCYLIQLTNPLMATSQAVYTVFNALATIRIEIIDISKDPLIVFLLIVYFLIGLAIVSLFINLLHTKFSRAYWLPGKLYLPLRQSAHIDGIATFESADEATFGEFSLNHMTTLGIFESDNKCPLIDITRKDEANVEAITQTDNFLPSACYRTRSSSPPLIQLPCVKNSPEDVNDLIVETYAAHRANRWKK